MKRIIAGFVFALLPALGMASGTGAHLDKAHVDTTDRASLQRGARLFANYCLSCHSAAYVRFKRVGRDLGLTDQQLKDNLMFATEKVGDTMAVAMPRLDAKNWFGTKPPDLSVVARSRGADWLYSYLRGFYVDESRPFGVNNAVFKDVAMPHVLWPLEGFKEPLYRTLVDADGNERKVATGYRKVMPGSLDAAGYDSAVRDLVNFLAYIGEPGRQARQGMGVWVLAFLSVLLVLAYLLKKEYWKDVH